MADIAHQLDIAWGLIANVSGGDWDKQSSEWRDAAKRWRDEYVQARPTEFQRDVLRDLGEIKYTLRQLLSGERKLMAAIDDLTTAVAAETTVEQSAITLIQQLAAQIAANATDPAKISALASQLTANATALAAAITANTPVAPAAPSA